MARQRWVVVGRFKGEGEKKRRKKVIKEEKRKGRVESDRVKRESVSCFVVFKICGSHH